MDRRRFIIAGASLVAAALTVSACGTRAGTGGAAGADGGKVVKIGLIAPLTGEISSIGLGIRNGADLAVRQANERNVIPGWHFELVPEDDQAQADPGRHAATKLAGDEDIAGVVGPFNSSVGQAVQPVLDSAGIALISPGTTNPGLTRGPDLDNPKRAYKSFFRTCTTDDVQGPFAAQYLLDKRINRIATIHDKKAYGDGITTAFTEHFTENGGTVVRAETINPEDKDFSAVISLVGGANPQAVFYGGEYGQAGPLSQQMKGSGLNVPLMGGDGIFDARYIDLAGPNANGDLATSVGAPVDSLESAKEFVEAYNAQGYADSYAAFGVYAYDATNALIEALKTTLPNAENAADARAATIDALNDVEFAGATGTVAFDEFGDARERVLTAYQVTDGKWVDDRTENFQ